ncbi:hypothetical protein D3C78_1114840 [compost metagenome]
MGQSTRSHPAGVPTVRNLQQTQSISRDAGAGAQGRFVSGKAQPQKCQSTLRTDQGPGLRRRLQPAHRLHTRVARRARQVFTGLCAADLCTRGGLSIRLERRRSADRRPVPTHPGLPYEAVRQSRILVGCVSQPRPRDVVRCPYPLVWRVRWGAASRHLRQHEDGCRQGQQG